MPYANLKAWLGPLPRAILVGWLVLVAATVAAVASPQLRQLLGFGSQALSYEVGQRVDVSPDLYGGAPYTVLLFARANCRACQNAKPMLAKLMAQLSGSDRVAIRVLAPAQSPDEQIDYIRTLGLSEESLVLVNFRDYRIRGIPTLLLVRGNGEILRISQGTGESLAGFATEVASVSGSPRP